MAINSPTNNTEANKVKVLSLLTVSSRFNITNLNQGDHCTIGVCSNSGENSCGGNQPEADCDGITFDTYDGESSLAREILRTSVNVWFDSEILPRPSSS